MDVERYANRGNWRIDRVEELVVRYVNAYYEHKPEKQIVDDEVSVIWYSKTMKNWRALAKSYKHKGTYFEIIHDGENTKTYLNVYEKRHNIVMGW